MPKPEPDVAPMSDKPYLLKRSEMRVEWGKLPKSEIFGFHRGGYTAVTGTYGTARLVALPFGQGSPVHRSTGEHFHYQIRSSVEFTIEGNTYVIEPNDLFFLPANVDYKYSNVGDDDAIFLSVHVSGGSAPTVTIAAD